MSNLRHDHVRLGGLGLHVVEAGPPDAPPVIFLHGWPQSWMEWRQVMTLAADEFRVIAIDLPGVGESPIATADGSKQALAAVVHGLIQQRELADATLVGHDIGGMIAYAYLRRYEDVARVAIIDVVIPGIDPWEEVTRNPYLWHFAFHAVPALPELLVQGHQGAYFDYFFNALAADPSRITPAARAS
jgi:pimeloyl-ACP methyl ester carboxylesterase